MIQLQPPFRRATPDDAKVLSELVNIAGEGLPLYLWARMAEAERSPWDIGQERARRDAGAFSYRNAVLLEQNGEIVSCLIGYPLDDTPSPVDYSDMPPMFVPLQQLEDMAPGTWYVNVLATYPDHRGRGYGHKLLALANAIAADQGKRGLSLIVADSNTGARGLYERLGYRERARRPMVKEQWQSPGTNWTLLVKEL